jgi:predicted dehydrogenase
LQAGELLMRTLSWGILGTGFISQQIAKAIAESEGNQVLAIASRDLNRAESFAKEFNIPRAYGDQEALLNDKEIDVIYIGLPNFLHVSWVEKCVKENKHVLCEKPFTVNAAEAQKIIESLSQSSVFCMEALMYKCHPLTLRLKELVQNNYIGRIQAFESQFSDEIFPFANNYCAGSILDLGCYPVSLILLLMTAQSGEMIDPAVVGAVGKIDEKTNTDIYSSLQLEFPDQVVATVSCSNHFKLNSCFRILGEEGVIEIGNPWLLEKNATISVHFFDGREDEIIEVTTDYSLYCHEIHSVAECIHSGCQQSELVDWKSSLQVMRVLDQWRSRIGLVFEPDSEIGTVV